MTPVQVGIAVVAFAGSVAGGTVGAVQWADNRYVAQEKFADLLWSQLKGQLRELRKALAADPENQDIKDEIEATLDRLCKQYPEDRDCQ